MSGGCSQYSENMGSSSDAAENLLLLEGHKVPFSCQKKIEV